MQVSTTATVVKKQKSVLKTIYILSIVLICALPVLLMPLMSSKQENNENRVLAAPTKFFVDGKFNFSFTSEFQDYLRDHFAGKPYFTTLYGSLYDSLFHESVVDKVIVGKNDFVFFSETLDDYLGITLSEREILIMSHVIRSMQTYVRSKGAEFVFTVAPNKNSLYPQYMPSRYKKISDNTNIELLTKHLSGVNYVDLFKLFREADPNITYYYKRDSHWNRTGVLMGYNAIMKALLSSRESYETYASLIPEIEKTKDGDIDKMYLPSLKIKDDEVVFKNFTQKYVLENRIADPEAIKIPTHIENASTGRLLMFRDSFTNDLYPFLSNYFSYAEYLRNIPYQFSNLETDAFDYVVFEIVERNLSNIIRRAPIIPAMESSVSLTMFDAYQTMDQNKNVPTTAYVETSKGLVHVYGYVDPELITNSDASMLVKVFSRYSEDEAPHILEPFMILESEAIAKQQQNFDPSPYTLSGFSFYFPESFFEEGHPFNLEISIGSKTLTNIDLIFIN